MMTEQQVKQATQIGNALGEIVKQVVQHGPADDLQQLQEQMALWFANWLRLKEQRHAAKN